MTEMAGSGNFDEIFDSLQENIRNLQKEYLFITRELQQLFIDPFDESITKKSEEMLKIQVDIQSKINQLVSMCTDADTLKRAEDFKDEMMIEGLVTNFANVTLMKSSLAESEQLMNEFKLFKNDLKEELAKHDHGQLTGPEATLVNRFVELINDTDTEKSNKETVDEIMEFSVRIMQTAMLARLAPTNDRAIGASIIAANDESEGAMAMTKSNGETSNYNDWIDTVIELCGGSDQAPSEIMDKMEMGAMLFKSRISDDTKDPEPEV